MIGALQGVTELLPVSSLGHSVLLPAVIGGSWARDLDVSAAESPYLAFIVGLHVATALGLLVFFWRDWVRIVRGLGTSIARREIRTSDHRLAWLLVAGTILVGVAGLLLEHTFRGVLSRPTPTALFLVLNGLVLLGAEALRRRVVLTQSPAAHSAGPSDGRSGVTTADTVHLRPTSGQGERPSAVVTPASPDEVADERLGAMPWLRAVGIGAAQIAALCPGISRSGATIAAGLLRGLSHEDAARFAFLLSTPVILAAGILKLGDLACALRSSSGACCPSPVPNLSVRFLTKYFENRSFRPFGIYCIVVGGACPVLFALR